jgi:uncharacterized membrane protein YjgN (DUF898 family)
LRAHPKKLQISGENATMSTDSAAIEPNPTHVAPLAEPEAAQTRVLPIEFTGSGSEYFRIWIVNLLLTLVTVGLYFPWAKVRRLRYFYGNTLVDGEPLGFHGNAFKMFKGFVIVAAFFGLYSLAGHFSPTAGFVMFLVIAALWPALFKSSMQFRMVNTSWRGLRFGFGGTTQDAYRACLPLFIPSVLILGLMLIAPELQDPSPKVQPSSLWLGIFGLLMLLTLLISPWLMWNLKNYQHSHYRYSSETTRFGVTAKSFFGLSLKLIGVVLLAYIVLSAVILVAVLGGAVLGSVLGGSTMSPLLAFVGGLIAAMVGVLAFATIKPYAITRFQNLLWNGTRSDNLQFTSTLRMRPMVWLTLKNWGLMLCTLGLYWPFASIAVARMRLNAVQIETSVSPATLVQSPTGVPGQAIGEASGDFFGFDIGL